jgi:hypothetical protein
MNPYATQLMAWRAVEPTKRKIMVGVGGAAATPLYQTWSVGTNVDTVAAGLRTFFEQFEQVNGFALDGLDIDYEDSNALGTHIVPITQPRKSPFKSLGGARPLPLSCPSQGGAVYTTTGGAFALAVFALLLLAVIVMSAVPQSQRLLAGSPAAASVAAIFGALAVVGIVLVCVK